MPGVESPKKQGSRRNQRQEPQGNGLFNPERAVGLHSCRAGAADGGYLPRALRACSESLMKAGMSLMASSESIFRLMEIPAFFSPFIRTL